MSTGLTDQAMNYMADCFGTPIIHDSNALDYATLSATNGWQAPEYGFAMFGITPSNTSIAYAQLRNITDDYPAANISSNNGYSQTCLVPIIKGKSYKVTSASSNVTAGTRCAATYFKLFKE